MWIARTSCVLPVRASVLAIDERIGLSLNTRWTEGHYHHLGHTLGKGVLERNCS